MTETKTDTIEILINDIPVQVPKGELIVESVKRLGLEIPIFCYHPRMKPVGMCRMCLVEVGFKQPDGSVRKMPKPQAGCTLPASEGMVVYTDSEMVHRDRKGVLEFLLINHPLDCPICDRGGECPLQNNTLFYGPSSTRFVEFKRHLPKAYPLSQYVTLDLERCIQCGRCVRFTEEISGDSQLAFRFRGASMQPSTFELTNFESKFSGNVIEICPVGALTSAKYRFRARPWDIETKPAICTQCSNGCNIWFDYRIGKMARINGRINEGVNEEWTCDRGKFGHEFYNADNRLTAVYKRNGNSINSSDWATAQADLVDVLSKKPRVAALIGGTLSNESVFMAKRLFVDRLCAMVGHSTGPVHVASRLADLDTKKKLVAFGTSLADDLPMFHLRARKAVTRNGASLAVLTSATNELDNIADTVVRYKPGTLASATELILRAGQASGKLKLDSDTAARIADVNVMRSEIETAVSESSAQAMFEALSGATVLSSESLMQEPDSQFILDALKLIAEQTGGEFNCYPVDANGYGLATLLPDASGVDDVLMACARGEVDVLWVAGIDPFEHASRDLVVAALEQVEYLAIQGISRDECFEYASLVLPMTAPAESDGTFTNAEGRVQRMPDVLGAKGDAKVAWRLFFDVDVRLRMALGSTDYQDLTTIYSSQDVLKLAAESVPALRGISWDSIGLEGSLLPLNSAQPVGATK